MTLHDIYLLSPEIGGIGVAVALLVLDLFVRRRGVLPIVAVLGLLVPLGFSIALSVDLYQDGADKMQGLFGTLVVDRFSLFFKYIFLGVVALVLLASTDYVRNFRGFQAEYYALILFSASGMMLLASTTELITIYIALELTALPIAALAAFLRSGRSAESGMKFLILSAISSAILLYGMVLVYGFTGTTHLDGIATALGSLDTSSGEPFGSYLLLMGIVLMVAGFGFKLAIVPFHMWAPDVYEGSPTPVTAFLSVASKAAGFAVVLRVFYVAFSQDIVPDVVSIDWSAVFAILAALSMTIGNLVAITQSNIKRMLAYSTVAHAGYIAVGLAAVSVRAPGDPLIGPSGVLFYIAGYAATNMAAFIAIIVISNRIASDRIEDFAGMGRRAPYLAAVLGFALISLTGIPPTVGFMVKVFIFGSAITSGLTWLAVVGAINSVVSAYYYLRVVKVMYLAPPASDEPVTVGIPVRFAIATTLAAVLFFGIYPTPLLNAARKAAEVLLS